MRTLTEKYNGVLKGTYTKDQFIREARMQFPNLITQHNSYQDATRILLNKGIITECVEEATSEACSRSSEDVREDQSSDFDGTGLVVVGNTQLDNNAISDMLEDSPYYGVWNAREGYFFFKEEEDMLDELEQELEQEFAERGINARFEMQGGLAELKEDHSKNPKDKYVVRPCKNKKEPWAVWEGETRVKGFATKEEAKEYADKQNKKQGLSESGKKKPIKRTLQEGPEEVNGAYEDIVELVKKHARRLNDDDAYELHEQLKSFFNRLLESDQQPNAVQVGDVIDHKGVQKKVVRIDGHRVFLQPVDSTGGGVEIDRKLGIDRDLAMTGRSLAETKEVKYESPKAELPLDVLHHGIRFELDKKGIGNTPNQEEYLKAYKLASKNITKDLLFYKKEEGAEQLPDNSTDQLTKVKLKEGIKEIIKKLLSEDVTKVRKPFNIKGQLL